MGRMSRGFTLIETIIVIALLTVMLGVMVYIFRVVLACWPSQETRTGVGASVEKTIKVVASVDLDTSVSPALRMGLREASAISDHSGRNEIRFAVKQRDASDQPVLDAQNNPVFSYYIYYLYNANNTYPPSFNQSSYQLRRAALSGVTGATTAALDAGTFTFGSGSIVSNGVLPPPASGLSVSNNMATLDVSIGNGNETVRSRTRIHPRNIDNE